MRTLFIVLALTAGLMTGCSSSTEETVAKEQKHEVLYDAVNQPLEKAKGVEQQLMDNAAERKEQADAL